MVKEFQVKAGCAALPAEAWALKAVLNLWREEQAGQSPPFLMPIMERGVPPFVLARVVGAVLTAEDSKHAQKQVAIEPPQYVF